MWEFNAILNSSRSLVLGLRWNDIHVLQLEEVRVGKELNNWNKGFVIFNPPIRTSHLIFRFCRLRAAIAINQNYVSIFLNCKYKCHFEMREHNHFIFTNIPLNYKFYKSTTVIVCAQLTMIVDHLRLLATGGIKKSRSIILFMSLFNKLLLKYLN